MPEVQKTYWCIAPSAEAESYGDDNPRKPYQVVITKNDPSNISKMVRVSSIYYYADGLTIDEDSNASAWVKSNELYETKEAALIAYKKEIQNFIDELESDIAGWREHLKTLD